MDVDRNISVLVCNNIYFVDMAFDEENYEVAHFSLLGTHSLST